jgi:hypothetical protein
LSSCSFSKSQSNTASCGILNPFGRRNPRVLSRVVFEMVVYALADAFLIITSLNTS